MVKFLILDQTKHINKMFILLKKISGSKSVIKKEKKRFRPTKSEVLKLHCNNKEFLKNFKWKPSDFKKLVHTFNWYKKIIYFVMHQKIIIRKW